MSQHTFKTTYRGQPATVQMGWDRPLQGYFLVVEFDDVRANYIYTNLGDPELAHCWGLPGDLGYFCKKLDELGIALPGVMIAEILADAMANMGNREVSYDSAGML